MNNLYVLNNSHDNTLFYKDHAFDTRLINESKRFISRVSAEKFLSYNNLSENYSVRIAPKAVIKESIDRDTLAKEIQSSIDDTKDMVDTTIEFIDACRSKDDKSVNEEYFDQSNIDDIIEKLRKIKKYMSGISFTPYFDNSLGSTKPIDGESSNKGEVNSTEDGDSHE